MEPWVWMIKHRDKTPLRIYENKHYANRYSLVCCGFINLPPMAQHWPVANNFSRLQQAGGYFFNLWGGLLFLWSHGAIATGVFAYEAIISNPCRLAMRRSRHWCSGCMKQPSKSLKDSLCTGPGAWQGCEPGLHFLPLFLGCGVNLVAVPGALKLLICPFSWM